MCETDFLKIVLVFQFKLLRWKTDILLPSLQNTKQPVSLIWPSYKSVFSKQRKHTASV